MRAALLAIFILLSLNQQAMACRGPFSAFSLYASPEHQAFLGKVTSVSEKTVKSGSTYERKVVVATLSVSTAWQPNPPSEVVIEEVHSNIGDPESCVRSIFPAPGEEWFVIATKYSGVFSQEGIRAMRVSDPETRAYIVKQFQKSRSKMYKPKGQ